MGIKKYDALFLASTIPLSSTHILASLQVGTRVICNDANLCEAVKVLNASLNFSNSTVDLVPSSTRAKLRYMWRATHSGQSLLVTHPCCWPLLDLLLLIRGTRVTVLNLQATTAMAPVRASDLHTLYTATAGPHTGFHVNLLRLTTRILLLPFFYFMVANSPGKQWLAWTPRNWMRRRFIHISDTRASVSTLPHLWREASGRQSTPDETREPTETRALLLLGLGSQDRAQQVECYTRAIETLNGEGYRVFLKDHLREGAQIYPHLSPSIANGGTSTLLESANPAELAVLQYDVDIVLGVESAALALVGQTAISLLYLLEMADHEREAKFSYLRKLPGGDTILFPTSWWQLREVLKDIRRF